MLLAELEVWHTRPAVPTRRIALGHMVLPVDPAPGFGGLLLGSIIAAHLAGINDDFIKRTRNEITPGTSALFVLTSDAVRDRVQQAFAGQRAELLFTNLSTEQENTLREAFAEQPE